MCIHSNKHNRSRVHLCRASGTDACFLSVFNKTGTFKAPAAFRMPKPILRFFTLCGFPVAHMGPPYMANPGVCKVLSPTRSYAGSGAGFVRFQGPHCHIQLEKTPNGVYFARTPGLAVVLVPRGTNGTPTCVKKRETGLGILF